jgi:UDP:flavonoid glycosyltransferase YjiC (YdhE family)
LDRLAADIAAIFSRLKPANGSAGRLACGARIASSDPPMKIGLQTWGSEGDVQPFTALAGGLVSAGHDVTLVVTDDAGRDYRPIADRLGFQLVEVRAPDTGCEHRNRIWRELIECGKPMRQARMVYRLGLRPVIEPMLAAAKELCRDSHAVIGHFLAFPLQIAAEAFGVSSATLTVSHCRVPSAHLPPPGRRRLRPWLYPLGWNLAQWAANRVFLTEVNSLRQREGLPPVQNVMTQTFASERLDLIAVSPTLCRVPPDWPAQHRVCGFLNPNVGLSREELPDGMEEFLAAGPPPIYFTFGSMLIQDLPFLKQTAEICMNAARSLGCRAILQLPWPDLSVFPDDKNIFKVRRAPYKKVFPRCRLVVHHGGAGTTQSTLLCGRPAVIVAHISDQFYWGADLERLGVAGPTQRRKGLQPAGLARAIAAVLNSPDMEPRAQGIGRQMAEEDGVAEAVRLIEEELCPHRQPLLAIA